MCVLLPSSKRWSSPWMQFCPCRLMMALASTSQLPRDCVHQQPLTSAASAPAVGSNTVSTLASSTCFASHGRGNCGNHCRSWTAQSLASSPSAVATISLTQSASGPAKFPCISCCRAFLNLASLAVFEPFSHLVLTAPPLRWHVDTSTSLKVSLCWS